MARPPGEPLSTARRAVRIACGALGALVGFAGTAACIVLALDGAGVPHKDTQVDVLKRVTELVEGHVTADKRSRIVYLGDSLSVPFAKKSTPRQLERLLRQGRAADEADEVVNVSAAALTASSHYFLGEELKRLGADRIIVAVNLTWFDRDPATEQRALAALLPVSRWPEVAALPVHTIGLSAADVVTSRGLWSLGLLEPWRAVQREQVRALTGRRQMRQWFQGRFVASESPAEPYERTLLNHRNALAFEGLRYTRAGARRFMGSVLSGLRPDDPTLRMLAALLGSLRATDARVLVAVCPTNVESLVGLDLYDPERIAQSVGRIRAVAQRSGADFLDLHDLLSDVAFGDPFGHLLLEMDPSPGTAIARQLQPWSEGKAGWNQRRSVPAVFQVSAGAQTLGKD